MAVSDSYLTFVLEQLDGVRDLVTKRMFGGVGMYSGETFFAVIDNDTLFFKVDEALTARYRDRGMPPFAPIPGAPAMMRYYQVPPDVLEDADALVTWANDSIRAAGKKGPKVRSRSRGRLSRAIVAAIDASQILGVRAGARSDHRFIGIWAVVVDGRVFARSWSRKPGGWYRTFLEDPLGTIQVGERKVRIRAVRVGGDRLNDAIERAYATKYPTRGSARFVRGFRGARRRETTTEFAPR